MKKSVVIIAVLSFVMGLCFASSYTDNEYQQLARKYAAQAQEAFDSGEYDKSVELSLLAQENADKSQAYIEMMMAKFSAYTKLKYAKQEKERCLKAKADVNFPMAYNAGVTALENGLASYDKEDFSTALNYAKEAIDSFASIGGSNVLPKYYVVQPWIESKDCLWSIAARSYVYNNSALWENLYNANKSKMKDPANPNLIYPGMKLEIPSIAGEHREGTYSPKNKYDTFNANR